MERELLVAIAAFIATSAICFAWAEYRKSRIAGALPKVVHVHIFLRRKGDDVDVTSGLDTRQQG